MAGTILLADSSAVIHKTAKQVLSDEGIEVISTGNGELALALLDAIRPDLVMVETSLPGTSGYALCEQIKREPRFAHLPVVLLAWTSETVNQAQARRVGVDAVLAKPFESRKLVAVTRRLLKQRKEALNATAVVIPFPLARRAAPKLAANSPAEATASDTPATPFAESESDAEIQFIELLAALKESRVTDSIETADAPPPSVNEPPESNAANETLPQIAKGQELPADKPSEAAADKLDEAAALAPISQHDHARPDPSHGHWRRVALAALALAIIGVACPVLMQSRGAHRSPPISTTASLNASQNQPALPTDAASNARDAGRQSSSSDVEAAQESRATIVESPAILAPSVSDSPPATADDEPPAVDSTINPPAARRSPRHPAQSAIAERNLNPYARNLRFFRAIRLNPAAANGIASTATAKAARSSPATPITRTKPITATNALPAGASAKIPAASVVAPARATKPPSDSQATAPEYTNGFVEIGKGVKSAAGKVGHGFKAIGHGFKKVFKQ